MGRFNEGDVVRVKEGHEISEAGESFNLILGKTYTVKDSTNYLVQLEGSNLKYDSQRFTLVEDTAEQGAKLIVLTPEGFLFDLPDGQSIEEFLKDGEGYYTVIKSLGETTYNVKKEIKVSVTEVI